MAYKDSKGFKRVETQLKEVILIKLDFSFIYLR